MKRCGIFVILATIAILLNGCGDDDATSPSGTNPIASFTESGGTVSPATISFQNTSQYADSYLWTFGDGGTSNITNPTHTYTTYGEYHVSLIATNSDNDRTDTENRTISITPGRVSIEGISIEAIPFTDSYGAGWDLSSGPDVYPDIVNASSIVIYESPTYFPDVSPSSLPLSWSLNTNITDWAAYYYVRVWDYDDVSENDYIGATNGFRINDIITGGSYASEFTKTNSSGTIRIAISLGWQ